MHYIYLCLVIKITGHCLLLCVNFFTLCLRKYVSYIQHQKFLIHMPVASVHCNTDLYKVDVVSYCSLVCCHSECELCRCH